MPLSITWLGHASVLISDGDINIYFDPWKLSGKLPTADIVLVTHEHHDHYSEEDIAMISRKGTRVVAPMKTDVVTDVMKPGEELSIGDIRITAVPAYNIGKGFHPRDKDWVGFIVDIGGRRVYHAGDSDRIPEMKAIKADIALMPSGGTYTMTAAEAALAVSDVGAGIAVPVHWGEVVGTLKDAREFERLAGCEVHLPEKNRPIELD